MKKKKGINKQTNEQRKTLFYLAKYDTNKKPCITAGNRNHEEKK